MKITDYTKAIIPIILLITFYYYYSQSEFDQVITRLEQIQALEASGRFLFEESVRQALVHENRALVALESTIITHGMPYPANLETARQVEQIVREHGATPVTLAIIEGVICVGLNKEQIEFLASAAAHYQEGVKNVIPVEERPKVVKTSRRDLSRVIAQKLNGATTVSATMMIANQLNINVFVTGGIGGVHRGYDRLLDVSADLTELGRTPVAVVCAGVKSILDIGNTLEFLETQGVPVMTYQSEQFPAFFTSQSGFPSPLTINRTQDIAALLETQFLQPDPTGVVVAVPIPNMFEPDGEKITQAIDKALEQLEQAQASGEITKGKQITPFLLQRVNELTQGKSLASNVALIKNNAKIGAQIARDLFKRRQ